MRDCDGCEKARHFLDKKDIPYKEIDLGDPLSQLGMMQVLGKDKIVAPLVAIVGKGFYLLTEGDDPQLMKIKYPR